MAETNFYQLFQNNAFDQIVKLYESSDYSVDRNPKVAMFYGAAQFRLGNLSLAFQTLEQLESSMSSSVEYLALYGATCRRLGLVDKAESILRKAIEIDESNSASRNNYANLLIDLNRLASAESILIDLLKIDPTYADAQANLNRLKFIASNDISSSQIKSELPSHRSASVQDFESIGEDPLFLAFSDNEVEKFGRLKRDNLNNSALEIAKHIPGIDQQEFASEQMKLAQQAVSDKNFKFCLKLCSKCLDSIGPNEVIYDCAADAYIGLGKFSQAEICLLHAISLSDVPNIKYYINLISLVCIRGDFNLAFKYLERAASIDPSHEKLPEIRSNISNHSAKKPKYRLIPEWDTKSLQRLQ